MDALGERIIRDEAWIKQLRREAQDHLVKADACKELADKAERLLDLARLQR